MAQARHPSMSPEPRSAEEGAAVGVVAAVESLFKRIAGRRIML